MALTEDQTRLKAAIVAKWSILANTIQDDDVITLWNARYQHVDLLDGVSREDLQKASLHPAVLGVIKPAAGLVPLTEDQTMLKAAIVAKWSSLANIIRDNDVITLWNARYQHVDLLDGISREDLQKASLHPAVLSVIKPAAGLAGGPQQNDSLQALYNYLAAPDCGTEDLRNIPEIRIFQALSKTPDLMYRRAYQAVLETIVRSWSGGTQRKAELTAEALRARGMNIPEAIQQRASRGRRTDTNETFIVMGTPGIGKTALLLYISAAFAKNPNYRFVVHYGAQAYAYLSRESCFAFSAGDVLSRLLLEAKDADIIYLVDAQTPETASIKTVLATSPQSALIKTLRRQRDAVELYIPHWSLQEILMAARMTGELEEAEERRLGHRFQLFGGNARAVFWQPREPGQEDFYMTELEEALKAPELVAGIDAMVLNDLSISVAHRLFQYEISDMKRKQLLFASDVVKQMVLEKVAAENVVDVEDLARHTTSLRVRSLQLPSIAQNISTLIIQHIAYMHLRVGDVRARPMDGVQGSDLGFPIISLPVEQPWSFDRDENSLPRKEAEVRALRNTIIAPSNQIHPGVDAIVPPRHMIQVTTNVWGHAINGRGLVEAAKYLNPRGDLLLAFVVPEARRRSYYRQQKILDIEGLEGESPAQVQELQKKLKALKKRVKQWLVVLPPPSRGPIVLGSLTVRAQAGSTEAREAGPVARPVQQAIVETRETKKRKR